MEKYLSMAIKAVWVQILYPLPQPARRLRAQDPLSHNKTQFSSMLEYSSLSIK